MGTGRIYRTYGSLKIHTISKNTEVFGEFKIFLKVHGNSVSSSEFQEFKGTRRVQIVSMSSKGTLRVQSNHRFQNRLPRKFTNSVEHRIRF